MLSELEKEVLLFCPGHWGPKHVHRERHALRTFSLVQSHLLVLEAVTEGFLLSLNSQATQNGLSLVKGVGLCQRWAHMWICGKG